MPATIEIKGSLAHLQLIGDYTPQEIKDALLFALDDPSLPAEISLLMDATQSTVLGQRSANELRDMARFLAGLSGRFGGRLGMVAESQLHYGLLRMAEAYSEAGGMAARVFLTIEEAVDWLENTSEGKVGNE